MSKEIKLETLAAFDEEYMKDPIAKVMRRALAKNGIDSIAYVEENEYRTLPTFSLVTLFSLYLYLIFKVILEKEEI